MEDSCANRKRCIINEDFSHAKCKNPYNHIMELSFGLILIVTSLGSVKMAITDGFSEYFIRKCARKENKPYNFGIKRCLIVIQK